MKTLCSIFLLVITCSLGCTSTARLRTGHEQDLVNLNKRAANKRALVIFENGSEIQVENLRITKDSTYWRVTNKIATDRIKEVRFLSPGGRSKWSLENAAGQSDQYAEINRVTRGRRAVLILKDGLEWKVRQLWMTPDFTYWIDPQIRQQKSPTNIAVPTSQIKEVRFISRGKGALAGMGWGFLVGGIVGLAAGEDCPRDPNAFIEICFPREQVALALGLTGALISAPIGGIIGHRDVYVIEHEASRGTN